LKVYRSTAATAENSFCLSVRLSVAKEKNLLSIFCDTLTKTYPVVFWNQRWDVFST